MIRAIIKSVVQGTIQRISATAWGDIDDREYFQHYGLTSRPKAGGEAIFIRQGNNIIAIASDDRRYRLALEEGEVALYDDQGQKVHLKRDGIEVESPTKITATAPEVTIVASTKVTIDSPLTECTGNLSVAGGINSTGTYGASGGKIQTPGNVEAGGDVKDATRTMAGDRSIYNGHHHPENGSGGGTTSAPSEAM